ncbi:MAG: photosystem I assembly protein Ycf4 [Spirulinaceae cyanobacterium]
MTAQATTTESDILRQEVLGSRRLSNYFWAIAAFIGGLGFLLAGLSSYLHTNLLIVSDTSTLQFIPQGIALTFYGVAGLLVSLYQVLVIFWDVGGGYNEFNKKNNSIKIFRWNFPGKNRRVEIDCKIEEVQSVKADIKEGLNPKRSLYLRVKGKGPIPLTRAGEPISLTELENQGAQLARFLQVPLEGL